MVNYIVLEGIEMYVFIFLVIALFLIGIIGLAAALHSDFKLDKLREQLFEEREKNILLNRENFRYRLKHGELDPGKEP